MKVPLPVNVLLTSPVPRLREMGIEEAGVTLDRAAVPAIEAIAETDPVLDLRKQAIQNVTQLATPSERDSFLDRLLDDPNAQIAAEAASAAARTGPSDVLPHLRRMLTQTDPARVQAAIHALAKLGDRTAIPGIAAHMGDSNPVPRGEASFALDVLVGPPRSYVDWQAWAREKGYLR